MLASGPQNDRDMVCGDKCVAKIFKARRLHEDVCSLVVRALAADHGVAGSNPWLYVALIKVSAEWINHSDGGPCFPHQQAFSCLLLQQLLKLQESIQHARPDRESVVQVGQTQPLSQDSV